MPSVSCMETVNYCYHSPIVKLHTEGRIAKNFCYHSPRVKLHTEERIAKNYYYNSPRVKLHTEGRIAKNCYVYILPCYEVIGNKIINAIKSLNHQYDFQNTLCNASNLIQFSASVHPSVKLIICNLHIFILILLWDSKVPKPDSGDLDNL